MDKLTYAGDLSTLKPVMNKPDFYFENADICVREAEVQLFGEEKTNIVVNLAAESYNLMLNERSVRGIVISYRGFLSFNEENNVNCDSMFL